MDAAREPARDPFADRTLTLRWRTGLTQQDLARLLGLSAGTIQRWEAGRGWPGARQLQALIAVYLDRGVLPAGREEEAAAALWAAAVSGSRRLIEPFDPSWFAALRARRPAPFSGIDVQARRQDWGEAPDTTTLFGRTEELAALTGWTQDEHTHLIALLGMGGIGKTALAARLAQELVSRFEYVYWRSLHNALPVEEWLADALGLLSGQQTVPPDGVDARLALLRALLRDRRALLVLDNLETVLEPGEPRARYRAGYEGYGQVLQRLGGSDHRGCLLVTSREAPPEVAPLEGPRYAWQVLYLGGLGIEESRDLLRQQDLVGDATAWRDLVERYGGNALALRLVGETIAEAFAGDIAAFLAEGEALSGDLRQLLDRQVGRLSALERSVLAWLAIEREPVGFADLAADLDPVARGAALGAMEALRRRSLLERGGSGTTVTLQPVVLEHVTDRLIEDMCREIAGEQPVLLESHALVQASAKDYVRRSQERLIALPLLACLTSVAVDRTAVEGLLLALLDRWRGQPAGRQGYGPGNVVNLLRLLRGELRGMDLSRLHIRQAYLQDTEAQDANLAGTHLAQPALAEAFYNVFSVALSADGAFLAAGTIDSEVRLWRVADHTPIMSVQSQAGLVFGLALSADGRLVAGGGVDGTVKLWEAPSGRLLHVLRGHAGQVPGVAMSADGRLVASGGLDGIVKLWETKQGRLLATLLGHDGIIHAVAMSADGRLVASAGQDGTVRLWDTAPVVTSSSQECDSFQASRSPSWPLAVLGKHTGGAWAVALSGNGELLASGSQDGTILLWEMAPRDPTSSEMRAAAGSPGRLLATLEGHTALVQRMALSEDGRLLASGDHHGMLKLWDVESRRCVATVRAHTGGVYGVALAAHARLAASGGLDGTVKLWDAPSGRPLATLQGHTGVIYSVAADDDGRLAASGGDDGSVRLWELDHGCLQATLLGHTGIVYGVALSADGRLLASGGEDGTVRLWDAGNGLLIDTLHGHAGLVRSIAISADGRLVASGGQDGTVRLWEVAPRNQRAGVESPCCQLAMLQGHSGLIFALALSADGHLLASASYDGTVRLWEVASAGSDTRKQARGRPLATLKGHGGLIFALALSADGRLLASGGEDNMVRLWETGSGRLLTTLQGHAGPVFGLTLSRDGRRVASGGLDGAIKLWEAAPQDPLAGVASPVRLLETLQGHSGLIYAVAMSTDGARLVSCGDDGLVKLWDAQTCTCLRTLRPDRRYERMAIAGLTGITEAQREALTALGAVEWGATE
jgi:WD40 repeat protein/transcriptional regulator with XRE-family HTH domain